MKIYLDSQHISRFSEDQSLFRSVFSEYNGDFVFSFVHIHECLPKNLNNTERGLGRIEFMMNIEKSKFLIQAYDIFNIEDNGKFNNNHLECSIEECILGRGKSFEFDFLKILSNMIKKFMKENYLSESERRSQQAKFIKRGKINKKSMIEFLSSINPLSEDYMLLDQLGILKYMNGEINEYDLNFRCRQWILNPYNFTQLQGEDHLYYKQVSENLWNQNKKIYNFIDTLKDAVILFMESKSLDFRSMHKLIDDEKLNQSLVMISYEKFFGKTKPINDIQDMQSFYLFSSLIIKFIFEKIKNAVRFSGRVRYRSSDYADILHASYAPYVDIFCCDKRTKSLINKIYPKLNNIVVQDEEILQWARGSGRNPHE